MLRFTAGIVPGEAVHGAYLELCRPRLAGGSDSAATWTCVLPAGL